MFSNLLVMQCIFFFLKLVGQNKWKTAKGNVCGLYRHLQDRIKFRDKHALPLEDILTGVILVSSSILQVKYQQVHTGQIYNRGYTQPRSQPTLERFNLILLLRLGELSVSSDHNGFSSLSVLNSVSADRALRLMIWNTL